MYLASIGVKICYQGFPQCCPSIEGSIYAFLCIFLFSILIDFVWSINCRYSNNYIFITVPLFISDYNVAYYLSIGILLRGIGNYIP